MINPQNLELIRTALDFIGVEDPRSGAIYNEANHALNMIEQAIADSKQAEYLATKLTPVVPCQCGKLMPLLVECRDALPAIDLVSARLHGVNLSLANSIEEALEPWRIE